MVGSEGLHHSNATAPNRAVCRTTRKRQMLSHHHRCVAAAVADLWVKPTSLIHLASGVHVTTIRPTAYSTVHRRQHATIYHQSIHMHIAALEKKQYSSAKWDISATSVHFSHLFGHPVFYDIQQRYTAKFTLKFKQNFALQIVQTTNEQPIENKWCMN